MCKMTFVHLGVILYAICLSTQVLSQNSTDSNTGMNDTTTSSAPTMATDSYSGSTNSTSSPTGAGLSLHAASSFCALLPIFGAVASFLQNLS